MLDKDAEAIELAQKHYEIEDGITEIRRITVTPLAEASPSEPIKLLEVNENTVPAGVMPIGFGPDPAAGIHFPSIIVEVTPEEFQKIQAQELELPQGWTLSEPIPRHEAA